MSIPPFGAIAKFKGLLDWRKRGYSDNAPQFVKEAILQKYAIEDATWVETGTFMGATTRFLAELSPEVHTVEPAKKLFKRATRKFSGTHVNVLNGTSEDIFPDLLPTLEGNICFWLDGHYSAGQTFKGDTDCPVEDELNAIEASLGNFDNISILIDDVRCFLSQSTDYSDYPSIDYLVDWARSHDFDWRIEQDIFIIRNWV